MSLGRSWQFIGPVGSPWYRFYDWLRRGVNRRLVAFLASALTHDSGADATVDASVADRGVSVLEAGCGTAFGSSILARRSEVSRAICLDIDLDALREAKARDKHMLAVVADMRCMPFSDGAFGLVFNSSTVEHLDDPVIAVREMNRVCADDGRVFVGVPYALGPLWFQPALGGTRVGLWLGRVFTAGALDTLLQSAGLRSIGQMRYFWRFFIGAMAVKRLSDGDRGATESATC